MIFKSDIIEYIKDLNQSVEWLTVKTNKLAKELDEIKEKSKQKSNKAKAQLRDKSGKFIKK